MVYGSETSIERAIKNKATAVLDTSILFDYLRSCYEKPQDENTKFYYLVLQTVLPKFGCLVITPHALAELCNLAGTRLPICRKDFLDKVYGILQELGEQHTEKEDILKHPKFTVLGATDVAGILGCAKRLDAYFLIDDEEARALAVEEVKVIKKSELVGYYLNPNLKPFS